MRETKVTGSATFKSYGYQCPSCKYEEDQLFDLRIESPEDTRIICPNCETDMEQCWLKMPYTRVGGTGSDREIAAMQKSFRQRFVKKELDDVKHAKGEHVVNEAMASAAAQRIKKSLSEKVD